jgi:hypothetical protein
MSKYLSDVLKASPATVAQTLAAPAVEEEPIIASGGVGAPAPVLVEGDIKKPSKGKKLKAPKGKDARKVSFSKAVQNVLASKVKECNVDAFDGREATYEMLSAVYRRGAGSYSVSDNGALSRHDWAMSRVNAFASLLQGADGLSSSYTADFDLLPVNHPSSEMVLVAGAGEYNYEDELTVHLYDNEEDYESQEHAIFSLAEFSGLGYETIPAIRAAWMRGIKNNENPYERAAVLASALYDSPDADLLPKKGIL